MNKSINLFFTFLLLLGLVNVFEIYTSGLMLIPEDWLGGRMLNSDALYLPTLFSDLFSHGGHIKDWFLPPAPYFFPDYLMFLPAYLIGTTTYSQMLIFTLIQLVLTFLTIWFIARVVVGANSFLIASTALIVLAGFAVTGQEPFVDLLLSAYHYGAFLSMLWVLALWIKFNKEENSKQKIAIFLLMAIIASATALSDNLFLIHFFASIIVLEALVIFARRDFAAIKRKFSLKKQAPFILLMACTLLGSASYGLIVENSTRYPLKLDLFSSNLKIAYDMLRSAMANPVSGLILLIYIAIVLYSCIQLVRGKKELSRLSWLTLFSFLSLLVTLSVLIVSPNIILAHRYLTPAFFWPAIIILLFLGDRLRRHFVYLAAGISVLVLALMSWRSYELITSIGIKKEYYPEEVSCIDQVLKKENLNNGIAQYWDAKFLQNFSKLDLNIAQYYGNLNEMHWITSTKYFKPSYDFAIISKSPPLGVFKIPYKMLAQLDGKPKFIKTCQDRLVVVYGKNKMRVKKTQNK